MKDKSTPTSDISLHALAEGKFKSLINAKRLIDDGQVLMRGGRYLGAINSLRLAVEEIAKSHLFDQTVAFKENEKDKWDWFWKAFYNHKEKVRIIEHEFSSDAVEKVLEFNSRVSLQLVFREDSIYVKYDSRKKTFLSPEETIELAGDLKDTAELELRYASALFDVVAPTGLITIDQIERVFEFERDHHLDW